MVKLVSITEQTTTLDKLKRHYEIGDIYVNPIFIVKLREDLRMLELLISGKLPWGFPESQKFTLLTLNRGNASEDLTIVGPVEYILRKIED